MMKALPTILLCALFALGGCKAATPQMVVRVNSDLAAGTALRSVRVTAQREGSNTVAFNRTFTLSTSSFPLEVGLLSGDASDQRFLRVEVQATDTEGATLSLVAFAQFRAERALLLDMYLASECSVGSVRAECTANGQQCSRGGMCIETRRTSLPEVGSPEVRPDASVVPDGCMVLSSFQYDEENCGTCGNRCPEGSVCLDGRCSTPCAAGRTLCRGQCVDLNTSEGFCGACYNQCTLGEQCLNGRCGCSTGFTRCRISGNDLCTDTSVDSSNCGACGTVCPTGQLCRAGRCAAPVASITCGGSSYTCEAGTQPNCATNGTVLCCNRMYPKFCRLSDGSGTCVGATRDCSRVGRCGGENGVCAPNSQVVCTTGTAGLCCREGRTRACAEDGYENCWPSDTVCSTVVQCAGGAWQSCESAGLRFDCDLGECVPRL